MSKPLTRETKLYVIEQVLSTFKNDYARKTIKAWRENGFASPAAAAKEASGCGGFDHPDIYCPLGISVSADNYSSKINGFHVKASDGQEGIVTYQEIADVALGKGLTEQLSIFEVR